ncbi:response regulator [Legionella impletisoli]|uniref:Response regulator n=1 Tax=Legionella impletisoli TaxID=343510 RepID=A0A917JMX8_9GAMM|nr:response regulator [Legionella impletisoli]GGI78163.1 response regulator [Legionella impletisoli]
MSNIVIVDDALFMRKMLNDILSKLGHTIVGEGATAKEAISLYERSKPDLMTIDVVMPEEDGINTLKAVKTIKSQNQNTFIIIVSAMGQEEIKVELLQAGADDFITKPFQENQIIEVVNNLLK